MTSLFSGSVRYYGCEERSSVVNIKHPTSQKVIEIEWWSRHDLSDHQKQILLELYECSLKVIHRNIVFKNSFHFARTLGEKTCDVFVVAPKFFTEFAQRNGCRFMRFVMDQSDPHRKRVRLVLSYEPGIPSRVIYRDPLPPI